MQQALRQKPARAGRAGVAGGEAGCDLVSDEACGPRCVTEDSGSELLQTALTRENLQRAVKRVRAIKGAAGVDELDIDQTAQRLQAEWPVIREQVLAGTYRPSPVRRVQIPKPDGGERELGIPTVADRLIQQALLQVLQPILDPTFSEHSYGFRPGRRAHDAVLAAKPMATFKQRIRQLTRRSGGRSMGEVVQRLRPYLLGWKGYFRLSQTPRVWRELDEWLRHRMRAIQLNHWRHGVTIYRELRALGAPSGVAKRVAGNSRCWWRNSGKLLNSVLTVAHFDHLGLPRLS